MKTVYSPLFAVALLALPVAGATAADPHAGHGGHAMPAAGKAEAGELSEGTVRKIDAAAGKLTIAHGPLKSLGMPPMTMVFKAKDPALLKGLKVGDAIRFAAEQAGDDYVVTRIQPKK